MNDVIIAFNSLANFAGGVIQNNKFIETPHAKIDIIKETHEPEKFYCITVPGSAFLIKSNNKTSVTGNCHSLAGAWTFKQLKSELKLSKAEDDELEALIRKTVNELKEHEFRIIDMIFEKGDIENITKIQMHHFVESRLNVCLNQLGYAKEFEVNYNPIATWFYQGINNFAFNDFFSGIGASYNRNWSETNFVYGDYYAE